MEEQHYETQFERYFKQLREEENKAFLREPLYKKLYYILAALITVYFIVFVLISPFVALYQVSQSSILNVVIFALLFFFCGIRCSMPISA